MASDTFNKKKRLIQHILELLVETYNNWNKSWVLNRQVDRQVTWSRQQKNFQKSLHLKSHEVVKGWIFKRIVLECVRNR